MKADRFTSSGIHYHKHQSLNQTRGICLLFVHNISRTQALVVFIQLIERKQQHSNSGDLIHISNEKYWHDLGYYLRKWTIELSVIHPCASRWNQQREIKQRTTIILWQEGTSSQYMLTTEKEKHILKKKNLKHNTIHRNKNSIKTKHQFNLWICLPENIHYDSVFIDIFDLHQ